MRGDQKTAVRPGHIANHQLFMQASNVSLSRGEVMHLLAGTGVFAQCFTSVTKDDGTLAAYAVANLTIDHDGKELLTKLLCDESVPKFSIKGKNENNMKPEHVGRLKDKVHGIHHEVNELDVVKKSDTMVVLTEGENFHENAPYTLLIEKLLHTEGKEVYVLMCKDPPNNNMVSVNFYNSWSDRLKQLDDARVAEDGASVPRYYFGYTKPQSKVAYTYGMSDVIVNLGSSLYEFKPDGNTMTQGYLELNLLREAGEVWKQVGGDQTEEDKEGTYSIFQRIPAHLAPRA